MRTVDWHSFPIDDESVSTKLRDGSERSDCGWLSVDESGAWEKMIWRRAGATGRATTVCTMFVGADWVNWEGGEQLGDRSPRDDCHVVGHWLSSLSIETLVAVAAVGKVVVAELAD